MTFAGLLGAVISTACAIGDMAAPYVERVTDVLSLDVCEKMGGWLPVCRNLHDRQLFFYPAIIPLSEPSLRPHHEGFLSVCFSGMR